MYSSAAVKGKVEVPVCLGGKESFNYDLIFEICERDRNVIPIGTIGFYLICRISVNINGISTLAVADGIDAVPLIEDIGVVSCTAAEIIVALASVKYIVARLASDTLIAVAAVKRIVAVTSDNLVVRSLGVIYDSIVIDGFIYSLPSVP